MNTTKAEKKGEGTSWMYCSLGRVEMYITQEMSLIGLPEQELKGLFGKAKGTELTT